MRICVPVHFPAQLVADDLLWGTVLEFPYYAFLMQKTSNIREIIFQTFSFFQKTVHTINRKARKRGIVLETTEKNTIFTKLSKSFKSITWLKKNAAFRSTVAVVLTVIVFGVLVNFLDKGIQLLVGLIG